MHEAVDAGRGKLRGDVAFAVQHRGLKNSAPVERVGQAPQRDLGSGTIVGLAEGTVAFVDDLDDVPGLRFAGGENIAPEDPGMTARDAAGGFAIDTYGRWHEDLTGPKK